MALSDMVVRQARAIGKDYTLGDLRDQARALVAKGINPQRQRSSDASRSTERRPWPGRCGPGSTSYSGTPPWSFRTWNGIRPPIWTW